MGCSWNGFLPLNDIIKLQWSLLEACQTEASARNLGIFVVNNIALSEEPNEEEETDDLWTETIRESLRR
jgi:hypothetical protein